MACYHPLFAVPYKLSHPKYGQYRILGSATRFKNLVDDFDSKAVDPVTGEYYEGIRIPCGRCVGCLLDRSREMATRIVCESLDYPEDSNWFVTLTYGDDESRVNRYRVSRNDDDALILDKRHVQLFFKSLREGYERKFGRRPYAVPIYYDESLDREIELGTRFFMAGEYGDKTFRPHYHICLLNTPLPDVYDFATTSTGCTLYRSPWLESLWKFGFVTIGKLTYKSAAYVARYCMKKAGGYTREQYESIGLSPEFTNCSRRPGIGFLYCMKYGDHIFENDSIVLPSISKDQKNVQSIPRYFDKIYAEIDPLTVAKVKSKRTEVAKLMNLSKLDFTDLNEEAYLHLQEQRVNDRAKNLIRQFSVLT